MKRTAPMLTLLAGLGVGRRADGANNAVSSPDRAPTRRRPPSRTWRRAAVTDRGGRRRRRRAVRGPVRRAGGRGRGDKVTATWAGDVDGGKATIAIAAKDGVAIAYVCDGTGSRPGCRARPPTASST